VSNTSRDAVQRVFWGAVHGKAVLTLEAHLDRSQILTHLVAARRPVVPWSEG
jgi:hypothetical protein